jgi:dihydrodipicolinate reductase
VALLGTLATAASAGAQAVPQTLEFEIAHEGDVVGHHRVTFRQDGDELVVHSELEIEVAVLFFTV